MVKRKHSSPLVVLIHSIIQLIHYTMKFFISLIGFFLSLQTLAAQNPSAVLDTEQHRFACMIAKDTASLEKLLADDLMYIHSNSMVENKQQHLSAISAGKIVYQSMKREAPSVRFYGKIAICNGSIQVKGLLNGNPFDVQMLYTAVYKKQGKNWLLANWQTTRRP